MPIYVDHEQRRMDIANAAIACIAESGMQGLTIRAVAERLGGSVTLVTHYYPSRRELLDDIVAQLARKWESELEELEAGMTDPSQKLATLLHWLLPLDAEALQEERARLSLLSADMRAVTQPILDGFDVVMRSMIGSHVAELLPVERIDATVDLLRVVVSGIVLTAIEHTDEWPTERQVKVLSEALAAAGLDATRERLLEFVALDTSS